MIYLASNSPQRKRLLTAAGIRFKAVRPRYRETIDPRESPQENAVRLAVGKAHSIKARAGIVIAADTLIAFEGKVLGKPRSRAHAYRMLKSFSGKGQSVITGVAIRDAGRGRTEYFYVESRVTFKRMTPGDIRAYLATGEYRDKAGAFGLQGKGAHLIRSVSGSRSNIIGLPMEQLRQRLSLID